VTARTRTDARLASYSLLYLPNRLRPISMAFDGFLPSTGTSTGTRTATSAWRTIRPAQGVGSRFVCTWVGRRHDPSLTGKKNTRKSWRLAGRENRHTASMSRAVAVILAGRSYREEVDSGYEDGGYGPFGCPSRLPGASTSPPPFPPPFRNGSP
jgi:hypothetical protein